jgi:tape measure domain-containing protein
MAAEQEIERLIVRLMGDGTAYQKMLEQATTVTDQLGQEMKRLGGTEAEFTAITARAAAVTQTATEALGRHNWEQRRLQGLLDAGRISEESYERQVAKTGSVLDIATGALARHTDAVARGLQITRSSETKLQAYKRQIAELDKLFAVGAISQETYNRSGENLNSRLPRTIALEKERAAVLRQGEALTKQVMTAQERYSASIANANRLLAQNAISEQTRTRAIVAAQRELRNATVVTDNFGKEISRAGLTLRGFGTSWSIYVTAPITAFLAAGTMAGVKMDSLTRGLTAITHSSAKTKKQLEDMLEVAKLPGLGFKEAVEGHIRLQATGFAATTSKRALLAFGNALATVGKGKSDLDGVVLALTQISAKGKVMAQEINQLGERVPQIRKIMEEAFGTADTEKIQKMGLTSREFIEMIVTELEKLPKVTGGARNDLENFADAAFVAFSKIGEAIIKIMTPAVKSATDMLTGLGNVFDSLSPTTQLLIVATIALAAAIGPVAVVAGQATIAIGGLITAYNYLIATTWGLVAAQAALAAAPFVVGAAIAFLAYELSGMGMAQQALRKELELSTEMTNEFGHSMNRATQEAMAVAGAMQGAARVKFVEQNLEEASDKLQTYSARLAAAKERLLDVMHWSEGGRALTTIGELTGKVAIAQKEVNELSGQFKSQNEIVRQWTDKLANATVPNKLEEIKQQTILNREADNYIKYIERKIETLARGEAATKVADLTERGVDKDRIARMNELIAKEEELRAAKAVKTESAKLAKDVDALTAKLKAQVEAFGGVKYATDIQALADRGASKEALAAADSYAKKLGALKESADLADDVDKLTDKLKAEIAELKSGAESSELFALKHRGIAPEIYTAIAALEAEKKSLKEAADLRKDITTFTENLEAQVKTFGMASEEADLYKFSLRGATEAQLANARALLAQKNVLEENKKLTEEAKKLTEKHQPRLKFIDDYKELNKMLAIGAISQDTFKKETEALEKELLDAQAKADVRVRFTVEGNEAVRAGTAEFTKMIAETERRARRAKLAADLEGIKSQVEKKVTAARDALADVPTVSVPSEAMELASTTLPYEVDTRGTETFTGSATPEVTVGADVAADVAFAEDQLDGPKALTLLERMAIGIEEIVHTPRVVLNEMGTF